MNCYDALKHAVKAHAHEIDRCGKPAILHPIAVAECIERMAPRDALIEDDVVIALLHDVWEDTDYRPPFDHLSAKQGEALAALTRSSDEPYADYIERIVVAGEIAMTVKLGDIWHNTQAERQVCLPEKERKSLEKRYLKARARIWEALGYRWWPEGEQ